jgi:hypothetical protein
VYKNLDGINIEEALRMMKNLLTQTMTDFGAIEAPIDSG